MDKEVEGERGLAACVCEGQAVGERKDHSEGSLGTFRCHPKSHLTPGTQWL